MDGGHTSPIKYPTKTYLKPHYTNTFNEPQSSSIEKVSVLCLCYVVLPHATSLLVRPAAQVRRDLPSSSGRVHVWGWREGRPGTTRTGRNGTGEWCRPGSQHPAVSSSSRCTTVLRVRAYVTLVPTTLAHHGDESDFVALFNHCGWCRLHRFARYVVSRVPARGVHVGGVPDGEMD